MSLSVEYSYLELTNMGLSPPWFLMARRSENHASLEGCIAISIVFPKGCKMEAQNPEDILQIWIDWKTSTAFL